MKGIKGMKPETVNPEKAVGSHKATKARRIEEAAQDGIAERTGAACD
jgi:hypothetical protein